MTIGIGAINFDCHDVKTQSNFWSQVLGVPLDEGASPYFATINIRGDQPVAVGMMFIHAMPRAEGKNPIHVDLFDSEYPAEVERVIELGAERVGEFDEYGTMWTTLRDPEGNLFDIGKAH